MGKRGETSGLSPRLSKQFGLNISKTSLAAVVDVMVGQERRKKRGQKEEEGEGED